jgi:hypothetical protein
MPIVAVILGGDRELPQGGGEERRLIRIRLA